MKFRRFGYRSMGSALLIVLMMVSCEQEPVRKTDSSDEHVKAQIKNLGFDVTNIRDFGDYYLVENDILLHKDKLNQYEPVKHIDRQAANGRSQQATNGTVNFQKQRNITVFVDGTIPSSGPDDWRAEVQQAIAEINAISGSRIRMHYVTNGPADITIHDDTYNTIPDCDQIIWTPNGWVCAYSTQAHSTWPIGGQPGTDITINLDADIDRTITHGQKIRNMVHELGHCLGFAHTNAAGISGDVVGTPVPGTPTGSNPDPGSVMNGNTATYEWGGFSYYDRIAYAVTYPAMRVSISGPSKGYNSMSYSWSASASNGSGPFTYTWRYSYDGSSYNNVFGYGQTVTRQLPYNLDLYLQVTATSADGEVALDEHTTINLGSRPRP